MSTGNAERDDHIIAAVNSLNASGKIITTAALAALLPPDFELDDNEWREFCSNAIDPAPTREASAEVPAPTAGVVGVLQTTDAPDTMAPAPLDADALRERVVMLDQRVAEARARVTGIAHLVREARARCAAAISQWQRGIPRASAEEVTRQYLARSLAERRAQAERGGADAPIPHGPSYLDAAGAYAQSGGADSFVRKQLVTGAHRGALPPSQRGRKFLPSERPA